MSQPTRARISDVLRSDDWWESKLAPLVAIGILAATSSGASARHTRRQLTGLLGAAVPIAAAAHLINDYYDREQDEAAGRFVASRALGPGATLGSIVALDTSAVLSWRRVEHRSVDDAMFMLLLILPLTYSAPPIRTKERGIAGVANDALLAHVLPTALCVSVTRGRGRVAGDLHAALLAWSVAAGLRGILGHQILDREDDVHAGVQTFVARAEPDRVEQFVRHGVFPVEIAALAAIGWAVRGRLPVTIGGGVVVAGLIALARVAGLWQSPLRVVPHHGDERWVLWKWYRCWPALLAAAGASHRDRRWLPVLAGTSALTIRAWADDLRSAAAYSRPLTTAQGRAGARSALEANVRWCVHNIKGTLRQVAPGLAAHAARRRSRGNG